MDATRTRGLPPKLGIKKRKPRTSAIIDVANRRARKESATIIPKASLTHINDLEDGEKVFGTDARSSQLSDRQDQMDQMQVLGSASELTTTNSANALTDSETAKRKGLRHFAVRVCRKVEEKSVTTYNEVADELVIEEKELKQQEVDTGGKNAAALQKKYLASGSLVDEKNIRRRVYDSLNVLMAMGIIEKDKKLISWKGLAMARSGNETQESLTVLTALDDRRKVLEAKRVIFEELEDQATSLASLIQRNAQSTQLLLQNKRPHTSSAGTYSLRNSHDHRNSVLEKAELHAEVAFRQEHGNIPDSASFGGASGYCIRTADEEERQAGRIPTSDAMLDVALSSSNLHHLDRISLPFILVAVSHDSKIELEMDQVREDVSFTFSSPFAVFDEREVLRRMMLN